MNKLCLITLLVLVAALYVAEARGRRGGSEVAARERAFAGSRQGLKAGNRGRLSLGQSSGLRKGNRARGRRGHGKRLSAGNRVAGERFNNHKQFNDFGAVNDKRKRNRFGLALDKSDQLAKHQGVRKNHGLQHADGERVFHEERFDHEGFDDEEVHGEQVFQKHNDFGLNAANEDRLDARSERKRANEADFGFGAWR